MASYGTWAVIAGASEGIGAAFARQLAAQGYALVLIARRQAPLEALAIELRETVEVETHALDLGGDIEAELRAICAAHEVGVVVWNAALSVMAPFLSTPLDVHRTMLAVNTRGPITAAHVFGEAMAARGRGAIILLSSLTAFWGSAYLATYGATKAFNLSLAEALAVELGDRGIDVVACCAGATSTPGFNALVAGKKGPSSMTPDAVAQKTLAKLHKRGALVPGGFNAFAQWLMSRLFPRRLAIRIMAGQTKALLG
jgi:short-subunit dehydrogenase